MFRVSIIAIMYFSIASVASATPPTAAQIANAIETGKSALYALQNADGTWDDAPPKAPTLGNDVNSGQWGGKTAMAVYALITCGEKPTEDKLQKAIQFLHTANITGTYAVAVKCLVWQHLPPTQQVLRSMNRDARLLQSMLRTTKDGLPVWDYGANPKSPTGQNYSLSRTQYATLGLWAATETGVEVPTNLWRALEKTWEMSQTPEGGWRYRFPADVSGDLAETTAGMTAAAVASLYLIQDFTKGDAFATPKGNATSVPIERGLKWLNANFDDRIAVSEKRKREFQFAALYACERVGLASGLRRFGEHDWYAKGAEYIVSHCSKTGWNSEIMGPIPSTAWAILFLHRGRVPVAFCKLDYTNGVVDPKKDKTLWNQRPRDIANVTDWLDKSFEREMRWQIVSTEADVSEMLESPVMYLAGAGSVHLNDAAKEKLKAYVESGGLIVAHADGGDGTFGKSMMELGQSLCPQGKWHELPPTHPLFASQIYKFSGKPAKPVVEAIGNGVREWMLLLPQGDYARAWQLRDPKQKQEQWQVAANVLSYAVDKSNFYSRGYSWLVSASENKTPRSTVTIGRLKYNGNWNPEPQAFIQLGRYMVNVDGTKLNVETVNSDDEIDPKKINLLYVTGTTNVVLPENTRTAIKRYTDSGGTVMFEAAGGNAAFADAATNEIVSIFNGNAPKTLPLTYPLYSSDFKPQYRSFNILTIANPLAPQLQAVEQNGRVVAYLSREDLTAGILGVPTDGITGYKPESARRLVANIAASCEAKVK